MKFGCGLSPQEKWELKKSWHPIFIIFPKWINGCWHWMETVEGRICHVYYSGDEKWEYRECP